MWWQKQEAGMIPERVTGRASRWPPEARKGKEMDSLPDPPPCQKLLLDREKLISDLLSPKLYKNKFVLCSVTKFIYECSAEKCFVCFAPLVGRDATICNYLLGHTALRQTPTLLRHPAKLDPCLGTSLLEWYYFAFAFALLESSLPWLKHLF